MSDSLTDPAWQDVDFVDKQRRLRELACHGPEGEQAEDESGPLPDTLDSAVLMANTVRHMEEEKQGKRRPDKDASTFAERRAEAERAARERERAEQEQRHRQQQIESKASAAMWQCWLGPACLTWRSSVAQASSTLLPSARERILRSCVQLRQAAKQALVQSVPFASSLGLRPERIFYEAECFCLHFEHGSMVGSLGSGAFDGEHHGDTSAATTLSAWCHNKPPEPQGSPQAQQTGSASYSVASVRGDIRQR